MLEVGLIREGIVFLMGCAMFYALFSEEIEEKTVRRTPRESPHHHNILYCEGCKRQREHNVLGFNMFQCATCNRITDLSRVRTI